MKHVRDKLDDAINLLHHIYKECNKQTGLSEEENSYFSHKIELLINNISDHPVTCPWWGDYSACDCGAFNSDRTEMICDFCAKPLGKKFLQESMRVQNSISRIYLNFCNGDCFRYFREETVRKSDLKNKKR